MKQMTFLSSSPDSICGIHRLSLGRWQLGFESLMYGEQSTPPTTLPDGTGNRETDKQVGRQTRDIYVGRIRSDAKREDKNKSGRGERQKLWILLDICTNMRVGIREKVWREREEWQLGGGKTGWWERNRESVGGKAKQVYVEKRRKQEEEWSGKQIWKRKREQHKTLLWGLYYWDKHTNRTRTQENFSNA